MKKTITVILCAALCVFSLSAVGKNDIDLTLNAASNHISFSGFTDGKSDFNPKFDVTLEAQMNMHFKGEHGFFTGLGYGSRENRLQLSGGYAFKTPINSDFDLIVETGLDMGFGFKKGAPFTLGALVDLNFNYSLGKTVYLQFGLGWDIGFLSVVSIGNSVTSTGYFDSDLVLPTFGFGFAF